MIIRAELRYLRARTSDSRRWISRWILPCQSERQESVGNEGSKRRRGIESVLIARAEVAIQRFELAKYLLIRDILMLLKPNDVNDAHYVSDS